MAYISVETPKNTAAIDVGHLLAQLSSWFKTQYAKSSGHQLDPYNEHLLRDAGIERSPLIGVSASDHNRALTSTMLHTPMGNNISFIDLYVHDHRQHRAPKI